MGRIQLPLLHAVEDEGRGEEAPISRSKEAPLSGSLPTRASRGERAEQRVWATIVRINAGEEVCVPPTICMIAAKPLLGRAGTPIAHAGAA
jgi:hypothetical protein